MMIRTWYTQREWDRVVGWGTVPREYMKDDEEDDDDEQENRSAD